jgi:hypothetical protein
MSKPVPDTLPPRTLATFVIGPLADRLAENVGTVHVALAQHQRPVPLVRHAGGFLGQPARSEQIGTLIYVEAVRGCTPAVIAHAPGLREVPSHPYYLRPLWRTAKTASAERQHRELVEVILTGIELTMEPSLDGVPATQVVTSLDPRHHDSGWPWVATERTKGILDHAGAWFAQGALGNRRACRTITVHDPMDGYLRTPAPSMADLRDKPRLMRVLAVLDKLPPPAPKPQPTPGLKPLRHRAVEDPVTVDAQGRKHYKHMTGQVVAVGGKPV